MSFRPRALLERARALAARNGRPLRFIVAGVINSAFGIAIFPILVWSHPWLARNYIATLMLAYAISIAFAYCTYRIAFRARGANVRQVGLFSSVYLLQFGVNLVVMPFLVEVVRLSPVVAQLGFTLAMVVTSYFWHSRLTFRSSERA